MQKLYCISNEYLPPRREEVSEAYNVETVSKIRHGDVSGNQGSGRLEAFSESNTEFYRL